MNRSSPFRWRLGAVAVLTLACAPRPGSPPPRSAPLEAGAPRTSGLEIDHLMLVVSPGAPERAALERAGLRFDSEVNRHDGQGTASVTVELENAYLELSWVEPTVPIAPGREVVVEKFRQRAAWRTSGASPIGIALRRTPDAPDELPFPTWAVRAEWMPPGASLEILTPRTAIRAPTIWVAPRDMALPYGSDGRARNLRTIDHPSGVRRLTGVRLVQPPDPDPESPVAVLSERALARVEKGETWLLEITLDSGAKGEVRDLRPELPLILRY